MSVAQDREIAALKDREIAALKAKNAELVQSLRTLQRCFGTLHREVEHQCKHAVALANSVEEKVVNYLKQHDQLIAREIADNSGGASNARTTHSRPD